MRLSHLIPAFIAVAVGACAPGEKASSNGSADSTFRVALVTTGSIADQSWNSSAYAGLLAIRDSLGATISNVQTKSPAEYDENFRQYGSQQFDLVIGHGFEYQDAASRVAPQFPKTNFVITSGRVTAPNVAGVAFAFEEASYQAGVIAGMMTTSNTIGMIAGQEIPPVKASFIAFERGAKSVNPNVQVLASYIGNWEDVSAGKEQALAQISRGADIIFQNADAAGLGVFQAARERKILVFGSNADQNGVAPDVIIGSVLIDLPKALMQIAREVRDGSFTGRVIDMGVREDIVRFVPNPAMLSRIPPRAMQASDSIAAVIRSGSFRELDDVLAGADTAKPIGR